MTPVVNALFLVGVGAAAWSGGLGPGVLSAFAVIPIYIFVVSPGNQLFPIHLTSPAIFVLFGVVILVSQVASARRRFERALRLANEQLEERVKERTAELEYARAQLEMNNEELRQFAYAATHDLQEPLRTVTTHTQLLQRRYSDQLGTDAATLMDAVIDCALRMDTLIRDLLDYSLVAWDVSPHNIVPTDLRKALDRVLSNLRATVDDSRATVHCCPSQVLQINEVHLQQILQNLIGNALKYRSTSPPLITVSCECSNGHCVVCVNDNGIGIDPLYTKQIFEPFKRLHARGEYSGSGIGLALCQRLVQRYGGRIWVESELGLGSKFFFTVMAAASNPELNGSSTQHNSGNHAGIQSLRAGAEA